MKADFTHIFIALMNYMSALLSLVVLWSRMRKRIGALNGLSLKIMTGTLLLLPVM